MTAPDEGWLTRAGAERIAGHRLAGAAIFALALALRLLHLVDIHSLPHFRELVLDAQEYDAMASLLLAGDWLLDLEGVYVHGILYPVLLAACKGVGIGLLGARVLQAGMGALCCWLIYRIGCRSAAPSAGLAAGLLAAAYWPFIVFGGELLATTLVLLLQLVLVHLLLGPVADRPGPGIPPLRAAAAGMLLALLVMTRANAILLAPLVGWWVWSAQGQRGWKPLAGLVAGMLLMLSPYLVRNQLVQGSPVPFQGGWSLYQGANPGADGTPHLRQGSQWQREELRAFHAGATRPAERGAWYTAEALRFIAGDPGRWLELAYRKLRLFWHDHEVPVSADLRTYEARSRLYPLLPFGMGVVAPLALVGLVLGGALRRRDQRLLAGFALTWLVSGVLFTVSARYRLPAAPFLILLAGLGAATLARAIADLQVRRALAGVALLAAGATVAHTGVDVKAVDHLRSDWLLGHLLIRQGRYEAAETALNRALSRDPESADAHNSLAVVHEHLGRPREAERAYRRALQLEPGYARAWMNLGKLLMRRERGEAAGAFQRALQSDPRGPVQYEGWYHLGQLALARGDPGRAHHAFTRALEARSTAAAWYGKSVASGGLGRTDEQVGCLERAVALEPALAPAQRNLGALYALAGRYEEAERALRAAAAVDPADALTRRHLAGLYGRLGRAEEARRALEAARRLERRR